MLLPVPAHLIPLFDLIAVPLSTFLHLYFAVWRTCCPCPCLPIWVILHCFYGCLSRSTRIICCCPLFISLLFAFCFLVFPPESLPGDEVLCRLLSGPLPSVCFLSCLFCFVLFFSGRVRSRFVLVYLPLSCDHSWIRSRPVNNVR